MKRKGETGIQMYLRAQGLLDAPPELQQAARRSYWNMIKNESRKAKRKVERSFTVSYTPAELVIINEAAQVFEMSKTQVIKQMSLAYFNRRLLIPHSDTVNAIKVLLLQNYNALIDCLEQKGMTRVFSIELIEKMERLEREILIQLEHPKIMIGDT